MRVSRITAFGETKSATEWAAEAGIKKRTIYGRLQQGWLPEAAVSLPLHATRNMLLKNGAREIACPSLLKKWSNMTQRCSNSKREDYYRYGGKGVKVYPEWMDYQVFQTWALENGYDRTLRLLRKDKSSDYHPDNCFFG